MVWEVLVRISTLQRLFPFYDRFYIFYFFLSAIDIVLRNSGKQFYSVHFYLENFIFISTPDFNVFDTKMEAIP